MKFKHFFLTLALLPTSLWANWQHVGKADYNWGPFHVYSISLFTETGDYNPDQRPLMLSLQYAKPVEGKNFAITISKEIDNLKLEGIDSRQWRETLKQSLPDFQPNDTLSYIALEDKGYFVLNDTVLSPEFDNQFNQAFISIWLDPKGEFSRLHEQLLGKQKNDDTNQTPPSTPIKPESAPLNEDNADPKLFDNPATENTKISQG